MLEIGQQFICGKVGNGLPMDVLLSERHLWNSISSLNGNNWIASGIFEVYQDSSGRKQLSYKSAEWNSKAGIPRLSEILRPVPEFLSLGGTD